MQYVLRTVLGVPAAIALTCVVATPALAQTARDSSGMRIVTYAAGTRPLETWELDKQPLARIGGEDATPEAHFQRIAAVALLPGGTIVIAARRDGEIRVFGRTGNYVRTIGRRGTGPGEFPSIWELWWVNNELIGIDQGGTGQVFDTVGKYLRTVPRITTPNGRARRIGHLPDGSPVGVVPDPEPSASAGSTGTFSLVSFPKDSSVLLGHFPGWEIVRQRSGPTDFVRFGPRLASAVVGDRICAGYSTRYVISCMDSRGKVLLRIDRKGWKSRAVTAEDKRLYLLSLDRTSPDPRAAAYRERARRTTVFADRLGAYGRFVASAQGELWVGPVVTDDGTTNTLPSPREPTVWSVFTKDGRWIADALLPARFVLLGVTGDLVVGVLRSAADDEEVVVTYRLRKT